MPSFVFVTRRFETAFENEDSPTKLFQPQNTAELYELMKITPDLCGEFTLQNDTIFWDITDSISAVIYDRFISLSVTGEKFANYSDHWHPEVDEMYGEVCSIGRRGNIIVASKKARGDLNIEYIGYEQCCPFIETDAEEGEKLLYFKLD